MTEHKHKLKIIPNRYVWAPGHMWFKCRSCGGEYLFRRFALRQMFLNGSSYRREYNRH